MSSIQLKKAEIGKFTINFHGMINAKKGTGYQSVAIFEDDEGSGNWTAQMLINDMSPQGTPEEAGDRLSAYLLAMSKAVKGKNIKHLKMATMFQAVSK
ncbi:MAG: hypothetical protein HRU18_00810 [Pseudoalteromonas sp.]|uniref:hypothetical protein n=1 Tax=Pseudoalteromonas sp. TaxID=53249 RepID=UPI001E061286|nr:hypothetical protein [Pseudoalteromonas sp.]NRA76720.1 hypothetical protein [Pseudoalteromonas sp.]